MKSNAQEMQEKLTTEISGYIDAHLFESIVSLFHQGILKHYVATPRSNFNPNNYKLSVEAASGVRFEGREKIIELEKQNAEYRRLIKEAASIMHRHNLFTDMDDFLNRPEVKQILEEGE